MINMKRTSQPKPSSEKSMLPRMTGQQKKELKRKLLRVFNPDWKPWEDG
jgi:hypothetical protein